MKPRVVTRNQTANDRVEREFVATGVDADFERVGQTEFTHRIGQHSQIGIEFALEGRDVADIVHTLVEASGELRRDGLSGNTFVGDHSQND